jgi:hypothetical protein
MTDLFTSPKSMLRRARHHIGDLEAQINSFSRDHPWTMVIEKDADGVTEVQKVKFTKRLADDLPNIVFDCANNLRSTLDQMAYAIGIKHSGFLAPKSAKFPFGPTETEMLNNLAGGCKDLPPEIRDLFAAFKPYKGGNDALWAMNELCNTPKHKMLYPIGMAGGTTTFTPGTLILTGGTFELFAPRWDREKNEVIFARFSPENRAQIQSDFNVTFTVALDDVDEIIRGQHPVGVLRAMAGEVERVLMGTEAECRRIQLII